MSTRIIKNIEEILAYGFCAFAGIKLAYLLTKDRENTSKSKNKEMKGIDSNNLYKYLAYENENELQYLKEDYSKCLDCPISQTTIQFPVINQYGITYEKDNICNWLKNSKENCPLTKKELKITDLRPNNNLTKFIRFLILKEKFNKEHPNEIITKEEILKKI